MVILPLQRPCLSVWADPLAEIGAQQVITAAALPLQTLQGTLERITFYNDENGYLVARLVPAGKSTVVTVVGPLPGASVGESLLLEGVWLEHPQHGKQFEIRRYTRQLPATLEGIRKYLGSGLLKGIGPVTADRIVDRFGLETLEVLERSIERVQEVSGIGPKRVSLIQRGWAEQKQIKRVMLFLADHGVSVSLAVKIYKRYGDKALEVVRGEPYRLAREVYGIGFITADKIARALGIQPHDPARIEAGVRHVLSSFADEGHVFAKRDELVHEAGEALEAPAELVQEAIGPLAKQEEVQVEDEAVYLMPFYRAEVGVARRLAQIGGSSQSRLEEFRTVDWKKVTAWIASRSQISLTPRQEGAIQTALTAKVSVLTGGPGTGKTTTLRALIQTVRAKRGSFFLAAPTGRAAKRLSEACGEPAQTLHRLLEFKPFQGGNRFLRDRENPLDADLIIVDEVSMIDLLLMNALLKAVDIRSHILFVGDPDQLPSVGAGNVLQDLIASGVIPVTSLDVIFRQAEESLIVTNAHRINRGEMPIYSKTARDFFFVGESDPAAAAAKVVELVKTRIPARFKFDPVEDVQVLSPMHRGAAGVGELNTALQAALNPPAAGKKEWRHGSRVLRTGDKVLQTRNNYAKEVFNGDLGRILEIDFEEQTLTVNFQGRQVEYDTAELDELTHAYAMSVHKAQGSECRAVVMPMLTQHYMLLQRNLLYTGVTRARELVVLVGTSRAVAMAVRNNRIGRRNTRLATRLMQASGR